MTLILVSLLAQSTTTAPASGGDNVLGMVFVVIFILLLLMGVANRGVKENQRGKGQSKCAYCRARLKFTGVGSTPGSQRAGYAGVCSKCGRQQPWA